jgi:hypothetical protein
VWNLDQFDLGVLIPTLTVFIRRMHGDSGVVTLFYEGIPTGGTEVDPLGISMPTVVTEHGDNGTPPRRHFPRPW